MSETRRTEGGLIINDHEHFTLFSLDSVNHGLELPEAITLGTDPIEACQSGELFFQENGKALLALALSPRSAEDRLHIFPGDDMYRSYLEYYLLTGGLIPIVVSNMARVALEQACVTTSHRTGISTIELEFTDEQYARMLGRQIELTAEEELSRLNFDEGISNLLADNNE